MKTQFSRLLLTLLLTLPPALGAADFDSAAFDQATRELPSFRFGATDVDLNRIEQLVAIASTDPTARPHVEQKLLDLLAAASTHDARQFICRLLRTIGTARSVAPLEALLTHPELSHMARYALGRIEASEAGAALHRALPNTSGILQAGIIHTLGQRQHTAALPDIARLLNAQDADVAVAAIQALGRLGGDQAVAALRQARSAAPPNRQTHIDDALLHCAEQYVAQGRQHQAAPIYQEFLASSYPEHLRVAGLTGQVAARPDAAAPLLITAIRGTDPALRQSAIGILSTSPDRRTTLLMVDLLKSLPADGQERIIRALAERGDGAATPAVLDATGSEHETVRLAAYEALGSIGNAEALPRLAHAAASGADREKHAARASLVRLQGPDIDPALIRSIATGPAGSRQQVIWAVGQRHTPASFAPLLQVARNEPNAALRREAILAAGRVATAAELAALIELAVAPNDPADRPTIEQAITLLFPKIGNKDQQAQPVIAALSSAPAEAQPVLLNLLSQPATSHAFTAARSALSSRHPAVVDAAIRTLGAWPNAQPAPDLETVAATSSNPTHRALALRSYVRMAAGSDAPTPLYARAFQLARNNDEIKLVLGGLGNADTRQALEMAEQHLAHPELHAEAALAAVQVAGQYCWENPERARQTLDRVLKETRHDHIRREADAALQRLSEYRDYVLTWMGAGPFTVENVNDGRTVFDTVFPPESTSPNPDLKWIRIKPQFEGDKRINLERTFGNIDYCTAYLRTAVWSPVEQDAHFQAHADDYVKGWINGQAINGNTLKLRQGRNELLLKVGDHGGGWNFNCKLTRPDGTPLEGVRFQRE